MAVGAQHGAFYVAEPGPDGARALRSLPQVGPFEDVGQILGRDAGAAVYEISEEDELARGGRADRCGGFGGGGAGWFGCVRGGEFLRPSGAISLIDASTGCAAAGLAAPPLHPWLQALALPGPDADAAGGAPVGNRPHRSGPVFRGAGFQPLPELWRAFIIPPPPAHCPPQPHAAPAHHPCPPAHPARS